MRNRKPFQRVIRGHASCCFTPERDELLADDLARHELAALAFLEAGPAGS